MTCAVVCSGVWLMARSLPLSWRCAGFTVSGCESKLTHAVQLTLQQHRCSTRELHGLHLC